MAAVATATRKHGANRWSDIGWRLVLVSSSPAHSEYCATKQTNPSDSLTATEKVWRSVFMDQGFNAAVMGQA